MDRRRASTSRVAQGQAKVEISKMESTEDACLLCHHSSKISRRTENEVCRTTNKHSVTEFPPWSTLLPATNRSMQVKGKIVAFADEEQTPVLSRHAFPDNNQTSKLLPLKLDISSTLTTSFSAPGTNIVAGSKIVCLWDQNTYYPGVVTKIHSCTPDSYDVQFNDGDAQRKVALSNILGLTLYMGSVTIHQEQQSTDITGVICAIRPLSTNLAGMARYDPKNGISGTREKKKFAFKVSIASQQNPQKCLCFSEQTILQKRHPLLFPFFWNPPQHPPRQPATTINTHSRECTRLRIMTHYSKLYEGCKKCMRLVNLIVRFVMDSNSRA